MLSGIEKMNQPGDLFVTLLVPMRNEEVYISRLLTSIQKQNYPVNNFEVLFFDGLSSDHTYSIVENFLVGFPIGNLYTNPKKTQACAWNLGLRLAKGDIIGIVSAHCELAPDYISNLVETIQRTGAELVGGPTHAEAKGIIAGTIALALNSPFGVGNAKFHYTNKEIEVDTVFMGACLRSVYKRIGGFDEEMVRNQDDEFSYRLRENGGKIICNPAIRSRYFNQSTLMGLWKQYYQYGFYKVRVLQKHPRQMSLRQFIPPAFVSALLVSLLLTLFAPWGWMAFLMVGGSYLVANLAASLITAGKKGWRHFSLLPLTYAILHLSYGLGFLVGLIHFWNRWGDKTGKVPVWAPAHE